MQRPQPPKTEAVFMMGVERLSTLRVESKLPTNSPSQKPPVGSKPSPRLAASASPRGGRLCISAYERKKAGRRRLTIIEPSNAGGTAVPMFERVQIPLPNLPRLAMLGESQIPPRTSNGPDLHDPEKPHGRGRLCLGYRLARGASGRSCGAPVAEPILSEHDCLVGSDGGPSP